MSINSIFVDSRIAIPRSPARPRRCDVALEREQIRANLLPSANLAISLAPAVTTGRASAPKHRSAKLLVFIVLSVMDFLLTMQLLSQSGGWIYESNPLANWWLARGGWFGLALFKIGIVALVGIICWIIFPIRPRLAGTVLSFACCMLVLAVLYSGLLSCFVRACPDVAGIDGAQQLQSDGRSLDQRIGARGLFLSVQHELGAVLAIGRMSLKEAVQHLSELPESSDPVCLAMRSRDFPGLSDKQCLAVGLAACALSFGNGPETARRLERQLVDEFAIPMESLAQIDIPNQGKQGDRMSSNKRQRTVRRE